MRVAAGDEVDAIHLRGNLRVTNLIAFRSRIITKVRHTNHQRATLALAQDFHHAARCLHRIQIFHAFEILRRDQIIGAYS